MERRWYRRFCYFYKFKSYGLPPYLFQLIPQESLHTTLVILKAFQHIIAEQAHLKTPFFSWTIREWNRLCLDIHESTYSVFRQHLLKVIQPQLATFNVCNFLGLRLLTRLRLGLSYLNERRFNHNFQNCINPLCTCSLEVESISHFFMHCLHDNDIRATLLNELK